MKKIAILTFHNVHNYGGVLQAYSLQKYINENFKNIECDILDYSCDRISEVYSIKRLFKRPLLLPLTIPINILRRIRFGSFLKKYIKISDLKYTSKNIFLSNDIYDIFIVGSDQVWNYEITGYDYTYLLDFVKDKKRISYAASLGKAEISEDVFSKFDDELSKFNCISVREHETEEYLKKNMNLDDVKTLIDPTALLSNRTWKKFASKRFINDEYVLVYTIKYSEDLLKKAKKYAELNNKKLIFIGPRKNIKGVKYLPFIKVQDFVSLFIHANCVFTNSFHGTIYSIILNKQFLVKMSYKDGRNNRISSLLHKVKLQGRIIGVDYQYDMGNNIEWDNANKILEKERNKTFDFLSSVINE